MKEKIKYKNAHPGVIFKKDHIAGRCDGDTKKSRLCDFAEKTKISRQYWGDVFRGEKRVTPRMAIHMAKLSGHNAIHWLTLQAEYDIMIVLTKGKNK